MVIYSWFTHEKRVIFYSYVSLPEGKPNGESKVLRFVFR
jgi:hypothetical protein